VALQLGFIQVHFDQFDKGVFLTQNQEGIMQEIILLSLFYSQGFVDELCRRREVKTWDGCQTAVSSVLVWTIIVPSLCLTPVPEGNLWGISPRYPTYNGIAGAHFLVRTWLILGVCFFWWQHQAWQIPLASTSFPFVFYVVHWLPVDVVLGFFYGRVPGSILERTPWPVALVIALITSVGTTVIAQRILEKLFAKMPETDARHKQTSVSK